MVTALNVSLTSLAICHQQKSGAILHGIAQPLLVRCSYQKYRTARICLGGCLSEK